jgi:hypothetical protein
MSDPKIFSVAAAAAAAAAATACVACNTSTAHESRPSSGATALDTASTHLRISIPTTVSDTDGGTLYEIHCANKDIKWTIRRRYREFRSLLRELMDNHDRLTLSFLPQLPKRYKGVKKRRPEVVASRRDGLQLFLRAASAVPGIASDHCFLKFVGFEEEKHGHPHGAVRKMRQHNVAEMGHRMATLQRAGSAVLLADLVDDSTPAEIQGEAQLRAHSTGPGYTQFWCEMRGPAIFWFAQKGDAHPVGSFSFDADSTVSDSIPSNVRNDTLDTLPHCLTIQNAEPGHYLVMSVPEDAKTAWHAVMLQQQGHRQEAERALGVNAKRWTERAATVSPKMEELVDHLIASIQEREEQEKARRKARRQMFLMQHDDGM